MGQVDRCYTFSHEEAAIRSHVVALLESLALSELIRHPASGRRPSLAPSNYSSSSEARNTSSDSRPSTAPFPRRNLWAPQLVRGGRGCQEHPSRSETVPTYPSIAPYLAYRELSATAQDLMAVTRDRRSRPSRMPINIVFPRSQPAVYSSSPCSARSSASHRLAACSIASTVAVNR